MRITPLDYAYAKKWALKSRFGVKYPATLVAEARRVGLHIALAVALVRRESSGGMNVFGHDPTSSIPESWMGGPVTASRYRYYKARRNGYGMQGVGPCQLTWWETQDEADAAGGCWKPWINMRVGFLVLKRNIQVNGVWGGLMRYNGSGPAARMYANAVFADAKRIAGELGLKPIA